MIVLFAQLLVVRINQRQAARASSCMRNTGSHRFFRPHECFLTIPSGEPHLSHGIKVSTLVRHAADRLLGMGIGFIQIPHCSGSQPCRCIVGIVGLRVVLAGRFNMSITLIKPALIGLCWNLVAQGWEKIIGKCAISGNELTGYIESS